MGKPPVSQISMAEAARLTRILPFLAFGVIALPETAYATLSPFIRSSMQLTEAQMGIVGGALMTGTLLATLPVGAVLDKFEVRKAVSLWMIALGTTLFAVAVQSSFSGLYAALLAVGLVRSGNIPLVNKFIILSHKVRGRGTAMGLIHSAAPAAALLGALAFPRIAVTMGWGISYVGLAVLSTAVGIAFWALHSGDSGAGEERIKSMRSLFSKSRPLLRLSILYGVYVSTMFSVLAFLVLYLVDVLEYTAVTAGLFFGVTQLASAGGRILWGRLADNRFATNRALLLSLIAWATAAVYVLLSLLSPQSSTLWVLFLMIALGASVLSSWGIQSIMIVDVVGEQSTAGAFALLMFFVALAGIGGPTLFGLVLEIFESYPVAFRLLGGIAAISAIGFASQKIEPHSATAV